MKDDLLNQDVLETRILSFLAMHFEHSYTIEQLANEPSIAGTSEEIQQKLDRLVKEGLLKEIVSKEIKSYKAILQDSKS